MRGTVLKEKYFVKDGNEVIAILSEPSINDQFWIDFVLTPVSMNEALMKLY